MLREKLNRQVRGVVRDVLNAHPEYFTEHGKRNLATSVAKRLSGQLNQLLDEGRSKRTMDTVRKGHG